MPDSLWLFPILSGYYFLTRYVYFKYKYDRIETQRLIFNSVITGSVLFFFTYLVRILLNFFWPTLIPFFYEILYKLPIERQPLLWTFIFNFLAIFLLTHSLNGILKWCKYFNRQTPVEQAVDDLGDEIEQLFKKAAKEELLVQITLKSNKVYVGFVEYIPPPKESNYLKIIPLISGYRSNKTKKVKFNTDYYDAILLYQKEEEKYSSFEMDITIKQDEILIANIFDYDVYKAFEESKNLNIIG
nr:hypothetical protein [uncultured Flavobacterium sp.]